MHHRFRFIVGEFFGSREELGKDRRGAERFPVWPEQVEVHRTRAARILEESYNGIGLIVDRADHLCVGRTIELADDENSNAVEGVIVHLTQTGDGRWRVGIKLDESHLPI